MTERIFCSILAKYICKQYAVKFCRIERVINIDLDNATGTAYIITHMINRKFAWVCEAKWDTDANGIHQISSHRIIKEDEYHGEDPYTQRVVQGIS